MKTLTSQEAIFLLICNPLADKSTLAFLLEDLENSSPFYDVSSASTTIFFQTSPSILVVRFLSLLWLVITSSPFGQYKACCELNESPQTHSIGKRSSACYIWLVLHPTCFSREKSLFFIGITANQIYVPFSIDASIALNVVLHDFCLLLLAVLHHSAFSFGFWCYFPFLRLIRDYLEIE